MDPKVQNEAQDDVGGQAKRTLCGREQVKEEPVFAVLPR